MRVAEVNYRTVEPNSLIGVRPLSPNPSDQRLIASKRRQRPSAGLIVNTFSYFKVGALVEVDLKFPGQDLYYRSKGMVSWVEKTDDPTYPFKLGILVFGMDKLDPDGISVARGDSDSSPPSDDLRQKMGNAKTAAIPASEILKQVADPASIEAAEVAGGAETGGESPPVEAIAEKETAVEKPIEPPRLPRAKAVSELLAGLIGEEIPVTKAQGEPLEMSEFAVIADFITDRSELAAICVFDLAIANWLGAAIAMIPKGSVKEDVQSKRISPEVQENVQEICNICSSLFNQPELVHHKIRNFYNLKDLNPPDDVQALLRERANRVDFTVEVPGYGSGRMCVMAVAGQLIPQPAAEPVAEEVAKTEEAVPSKRAVEEPSSATPPEPEDAGEPDPPPDEAKGTESQPPVEVSSLPKPNEVSELISSLLGDEVPVSKTEGELLTLEDFSVVGDYILSESSQSVSVCALDLRLVNWLGSAIAMIPATAAKEDIGNKRISDEVKENIQEILNIAAAVFNKSDQAHHKFQTLFHPAEGELPDPVKKIIDQPAKRVDFDVDVPGYGSGKLSFFAGKG